MKVKVLYKMYYKQLYKVIIIIIANKTIFAIFINVNVLLFNNNNKYDLCYIQLCEISKSEN